MENLDAFRLSELISLRIAVAELRDQKITTNFRHVNWGRILMKIDRALELRTDGPKL